MTDKRNHSEHKIYRNQPLNPDAVRHMLAWLAAHIPSRLRQEQALDTDIPFVPAVFYDLADVFEALEHCIAIQQFLIESACSLLAGQSPLTGLSGQASNPDAVDDSSALKTEAHEQQGALYAYWRAGFDLSLLVFQHQFEHILWSMEEFLEHALHTQRFDRAIE